MESHGHFLQSVLGVHLVWTCVDPVHAIMIFDFVCVIIQLYREYEFSLFSFVPSGSYNLSTSSLAQLVESFREWFE